jgi:hypothetical protein
MRFCNNKKRKRRDFIIMPAPLRVGRRASRGERDSDVSDRARAVQEYRGIDTRMYIDYLEQRVEVSGTIFYE